MSFSYSRGQMIAIGVVFLILPIAFVGLRLWARALNRNKLLWDDYMIIIALAFTIGTAVVQLIASIDGQLGEHQTDTPAGLPILNDPRFLVYEKCKFALQMLSQLGVGASKASVLLLYLRIFIQKRFRICVQVMLGLVAAWTITFFLTDLFSCIPVTPLVEPFYGNQCMDTVSMWYAGSVSDIILDLLILMIPIPMVLRLQLPAKQKMGVLAMFFLGAVACAASIARLVIFLQVGAVLATKFNDETYYTSPVFFWTVIELALAIISACLPTLRPIYTHFNPPPVRTYSKDTSYKLGSSRFGGHPYSHTNGTESADDDYRLVLTEQEPSVQTHIETNHAETPPQLVNGRIVVSRDISSVDQVIQHV